MLRVVVQHSQEDDLFYLAVYKEFPTAMPIRMWEQKAMIAQGYTTLADATPDFLELCEFFKLPYDMDVVIVARAGMDAIFEELSMA